MSVADIGKDLLSNLEQAFDVKKVFTVFDKLINIIKDQQAKIDINDMKIADLYKQMQSGAGNATGAGGSVKHEERIKELEKKVVDLMVNLHGDGYVDPSVFNDNVVDAYKTFENAGTFVDNEEFIPIVTKPLVKPTPKKEKAKTIMEIPSYTAPTVVPVVVKAPSPVHEVKPRDPTPVNTAEVVADVVEDSVEPAIVPTEQPEDTVDPRTATPNLTNNEEPQEEPDDLEDRPVSRATTPAVPAPRAITPASPPRMAAAKVEPAKVATELRAITPDKPKVYLKNASFAQNVIDESYVSPVFDPPEFTPADDAPAPPLSTRTLTFQAGPLKRRRMSLSNLKCLTPERHKLILRLLKRKGMFLHIARTFQQDARKKYSESSLKNRVDILEADVKKILAKIDNIKLAVRKNHLAIKELLPPGFMDVYASICELLGIINTCGGTTNLIQKLTADIGAGFQESINQINERLKIAMYFDGKGEPPQKLLDIIMSQMRSTVLQDYEMATSSELNKIKSRLLEFGSHIVSKDDLLNMLSQQATNGTDSEYHENKQNNLGSNNDPMHMKLIKLVQSLIDRNNEKTDMINDNKTYNTLQLTTNPEISLAKLEEITNSCKKYTDDRVHILKNAIKAVAIDSDSKVDKYGQDLTDIQKQLTSITGQFNDSLQIQQDHIETFNKEVAALKILQRKVNNMGMDKLMEDLKRVHSELLERPSASQVGEMMDLVEATIKSNLGENIVGLKGLVEQVYKHIQHKVDRDDIKGLITVKLAQMEADLLRREEEVYNMTSTTRCLSCGQVPINPLRKQVAANIMNTHAHSRLPTENSLYHEDDTSTVQSNTLVAHLLSQSAPQLSVSRGVPAEQIVPLVTGNVGLKSLLPQHNPQQAVNPYVATSKRKTGEHIPEPLYRKAKMAAQMKEMVKVTTPSSSVYGYGPNNPLYVLDGLVDDEGSVSSLASQNRVQGSKRVGTTGGGLHFNNLSGSNLPNRNRTSGSGNSEHVTLPQINTAGAPTGFLSSTTGNNKPLSPDQHALSADYGGPQPVNGQPAKMNSYY